MLSFRDDDVVISLIHMYVCLSEKYRSTGWIDYSLVINIKIDRSLYDIHNFARACHRRGEKVYYNVEQKDFYRYSSAVIVIVFFFQPKARWISSQYKATLTTCIITSLLFFFKGICVYKQIIASKRSNCIQG